jgi:hypothetical protein
MRRGVSMRESICLQVCSLCSSDFAHLLHRLAASLGFVIWASSVPLGVARRLAFGQRGLGPLCVAYGLPRRVWLLL